REDAVRDGGALGPRPGTGLFRARREQRPPHVLRKPGRLAVASKLGHEHRADLRRHAAVRHAVPDERAEAEERVVLRRVARREPRADALGIGGDVDRERVQRVGELFDLGGDRSRYREREGELVLLLAQGGRLLDLRSGAPGARVESEIEAHPVGRDPRAPKRRVVERALRHALDRRRAVHGSGSRCHEAVGHVAALHRPVEQPGPALGKDLKGAGDRPGDDEEQQRAAEEGHGSAPTWRYDTAVGRGREVGRRAMINLVPGVLLHYFATAVVLALPVSLIVLAWYRRSVLRRMRERGSAGSDAHRVTTKAVERSVPSAPAAPPAPRLRLRMVVVYTLGAIAASAVSTSLYFDAFDLSFSALRAFMMGYALIWPLVPTLA